MKPPISVSDHTMFPVTTQPIDMLTTFEHTSDSALECNIREQIEYLGTQLIYGYNHPDWRKFRELIVHDVMRAYIGRRLIRVPEFKVYWLDSYRIVNRPKGAAAIIYSGNGMEFCVEYQMKTGLLHAVGRDTLRQGPGIVEYKRGQYEMHPHRSHFLIARHP